MKTIFAHDEHCDIRDPYSDKPCNCYIDRIAALEAELAEARALQEKAEYSARNFCGAHVGRRASGCPWCGFEDAKQERARLREESERVHRALLFAENALSDADGMDVDVHLARVWIKKALAGGEAE